jgi:hypothetical protein
MISPWMSKVNAPTTNGPRDRAAPQVVKNPHYTHNLGSPGHLESSSCGKQLGDWGAWSLEPGVAPGRASLRSLPLIGHLPELGSSVTCRNSEACRRSWRSSSADSMSSLTFLPYSSN